MFTNVLICGVNSYIGTYFASYISRTDDSINVNQMDMQNENWVKSTFKEYDCILYVAAIVHKKEKPDMMQLFEKVNCELALAAAEKAKGENVKHFIFMSTMSVYGIQTGHITGSTPEKPNSLYGKSKLQAERGLMSLADDSFHVSVLRPPMVYGGQSTKGNYAVLKKFIRRIPVFPDYENRRSFIHIDNLCEFIRLLVHRKKTGTFFPQDEDYLKSSDLVREIALEENRKVHLIQWMNPFICFGLKASPLLRKMFGDLTYDYSLTNSSGLTYIVHKKTNGRIPRCCRNEKT